MAIDREREGGEQVGGRRSQGMAIPSDGRGNSKSTPDSPPLSCSHATTRHGGEPRMSPPCCSRVGKHLQNLELVELPSAVLWSPSTHVEESVRVFEKEHATSEPSAKEQRSTVQRSSEACVVEQGHTEGLCSRATSSRLGGEKNWLL